ncbi:MAG: hypothetical protein LBQ43_04880 [Holosporales bacterium]|jgi:hypothetical protein|nr:hypothetical protein [Holosporales bacterium]
MCGSGEGSNDAAEKTAQQLKDSGRLLDSRGRVVWEYGICGVWYGAVCAFCGCKCKYI